MALLGRRVVPPHRLGIVPEYAAADEVHIPKIELSVGLSLLGR